MEDAENERQKITRNLPKMLRRTKVRHYLRDAVIFMEVIL